MSSRSRRFALVLLLIAMLPGIGLALLSIFSRQPDNLGVVNGRLAACPASPNCVCTQCPDDAAHHMEPIRFTDTPAEARERLRAVVAALPRAQIVTENDHYLHVEFTSLVFRFVDDVELLIDPTAQMIHFRSASRVGRSDLGVNKQRMEDIRARFTAAGTSAGGSGGK